MLTLFGAGSRGRVAPSIGSGRLVSSVPPASAASGRLAPGRGAVVHRGGVGDRLSPGGGGLGLSLDVGQITPA